MSLRRRLWELVETAEGDDAASRAVDLFIVSLIVLSVTATILDSIPSLPSGVRRAIPLFDYGLVAVFSAEYLVRLWACTADPRYSSPIKGRLRFATSPLALIDLIAIAPFYMPWFLPRGLLFLRVLRLVRLLRLLKVGRYSHAPGLVMRAFVRRKAELLAALFVLLLLLVSMAGLLYIAENPLRPHLYSSIPESMWWSILALTGNGQVAPITLAGRLIASVIAIIGVGLFALPAGLLASTFTEELASEKSDSRVGDRDIERITERVVLAQTAKRTSLSNLDAIRDDYDDDALIMSPEGVLRGPSGAVTALSAMRDVAGSAEWRLVGRSIAGGAATTHWEAAMTGGSIHSFESILVRDGLIHLHTFGRDAIDHSQRLDT